MDGLRWFLILFGLLVVVGVYWYSRKNREPEDDASGRIEPALHGGQESDGIDGIETDVGTPGEDIAEADSAAVTAGEQKFVTVRLVARNHASFAGDKLALGLRGIGMRHGKFGIFHRYESDDEGSIIFSAASLVEPGSFDLANLKEQEIPGISLFMVLPGPIDGPEAFDLMMIAARNLTQSLNAELLDETGSSLSVQRERYMREEIIQYQTSNLVH